MKYSQKAVLRISQIHGFSHGFHFFSKYIFHWCSLTFDASYVTAHSKQYQPNAQSKPLVIHCKELLKFLYFTKKSNLSMRICLRRMKSHKATIGSNKSPK